MDSFRRIGGPRALLPYEAELCNTLGISEKEYFEFVDLAAAAIYQRKEGYENIPDIRAGAVLVPALVGAGMSATTAAIVSQIIIGVALTAISYLLTPKPKTPETPPQLTVGGVQGRSRFAPQASFDSIQDLAVLGSFIPLVYARKGVRVNSQLMWSHMKTTGIGEILSVVTLFSNGQLGSEPSFDSFALGTTMLQDFSKRKLALYFTMGREVLNRIKASDKYPETIAPERHNLANRGEEEFDTEDPFSVRIKSGGGPQPTFTFYKAFSSVKTQSSKSKFGAFAPISNGNAYKVPWELVMFPKGIKDEVRNDSLQKLQKITHKYPRYSFLRHPSDTDGYEGLISSVNEDTELTYRIYGATSEAAWEAEGSGPSDNILNNKFAPWGSKDAKSAADTSRIEADERLRIGQQYLIGTALATCTSEEDGRIWDSHNPFSKDYKLTIDESGYVQYQNRDSTKDPFDSLIIQKVAVGAVSNTRECDYTEIGIKSKVFRRMNGAPNVNAMVSRSKVAEYESKNGSISIGSVNKYIRRFSFFKFQMKLQEADNSDFQDVLGATILGIEGNSPLEQYNTICVHNKGIMYDYRFVPVPGNYLLTSQSSENIYILGHNNTSKTETYINFKPSVVIDFNGDKLIVNDVRSDDTAKTRLGNPEWIRGGIGEATIVPGDPTSSPAGGQVVGLTNSNGDPYSSDTIKPSQSEEYRQQFGKDNPPNYIGGDIGDETGTGEYFNRDNGVCAIRFEGGGAFPGNDSWAFIYGGTEIVAPVYVEGSASNPPTGDDKYVTVEDAFGQKRRFKLGTRRSEEAGTKTIKGFFSDPNNSESLPQIGNYPNASISNLPQTRVSQRKLTNFFYYPPSFGGYPNAYGVHGTSIAATPIAGGKTQWRLYINSAQVTPHIENYHDGTGTWNGPVHNGYQGSDPSQVEFHYTTYDGNGGKFTPNSYKINHPGEPPFTTTKLYSINKDEQQDITSVIPSFSGPVTVDGGQGSGLKVDLTVYIAGSGSDLKYFALWELDDPGNNEYVDNDSLQIKHDNSAINHLNLPDNIDFYIKVDSVTHELWSLKKQMLIAENVEIDTFITNTVVVSKASGGEDRVPQGLKLWVVSYLKTNADNTQQLYYEWTIRTPGEQYVTGDKIQFYLAETYDRGVIADQVLEEETPDDSDGESGSGDNTISNNYWAIKNTNPNSAIADYFLYDSEDSSHSSQPEHEIVFVNEIKDDKGIRCNYPDLAMAGLRIHSTQEITSLSNLSAFIKDGIKTQRLINDSGNTISETAEKQSTNNFVEIAYDLLTNDVYGAAELIGTRGVNRSEMIEAAKYCYKNEFTWDGVIDKRFNLREFIFEHAAYNLLDFSIKGGQFSLRPTFPVKSDFTINYQAKATASGGIDIKALFSDGNMRNLQVSFLTPEEREMFKATVLYRQDKETSFPETKVKTYAYNHFNISHAILKKLPEEVFDLSNWCTSEKQAHLFAAIALATRKEVDHGITFETTPTSVLGVLPGDYIRVISEVTHTSRFNNGSVDKDGFVTSRTEIVGGINVYYWKPGKLGEVQSGSLSVNSEGKANQGYLTGTLFAQVDTTTENRLYKVESISYGEEGFIKVAASHAPLFVNPNSPNDPDNNKLAVLYRAEPNGNLETYFPELQS